jgi:hypothetical protein
MLHNLHELSDSQTRSGMLVPGLTLVGAEVKLFEKVDSSSIAPSSKKINNPLNIR